MAEIIYGFKSNKCRAAVPSLEDFEKLKSSSNITGYGAFEQVPNCTADTKMRTVAQNMVVPSFLSVYINNASYPDTTGILTIKKVSQDRAELRFCSANGDYFCHFKPSDLSNWAGSQVTWSRSLEGKLYSYTDTITLNAGGNTTSQYGGTLTSSNPVISVSINSAMPIICNAYKNNSGTISVYYYNFGDKNITFTAGINVIDN